MCIGWIRVGARGIGARRVGARRICHHFHPGRRVAGDRRCISSPAVEIDPDSYANEDGDAQANA